MKERESHGIHSLQTLNVPSECKLTLGKESFGQECGIGKVVVVETMPDGRLRKEKSSRCWDKNLTEMNQKQELKRQMLRSERSFK